ncbi:MAG: M48 family metalloprotease [Pseudomonadota bacterium]
MIRHIRIPVAVLFCALTLAGCASGVLQRGGQPPNVVESGAITARDSTVSVAQERAIGRRAHPFLVSAYGGEYRDSRVSGLIQSIVNRLESQTDAPGFRYRVTILNSPSVNAFALPGGYIYVTRGLLAIANTEAELAAVLAHEMAHVLARHAIERERATRLTLAQSRTLAGLVRSAEASEAVLANAQGYLARFSRQQEFEADGIGLKLAASADYDPMASVAVISSMAAQNAIQAERFFAGSASDQADFLSSHPAPPDRIAAIIRESQGLAAEEGEFARGADRESYIRAIDGLLYDDDAREGFVRGRTFVHPGLRITFTAPSGYRIDNQPEAVNAVSRNGNLIRFDGETISAGDSLDDYLNQVWSDGVRVSDRRMFEIDGMPAITARASARGWDFRLVAVRWSRERVFRMLFATRNYSVSADNAFLESAQTMRRLSADEAAQIRPLRVRAYQTRAGDTIAALARTLPFDDKQQQRFRVLNGLGDNARLSPGTWVKIVR